MSDESRIQLIAQHEAAVNRWATARIEGRTQIELAGDDRASFLHNMCTNDVKRLAPGDGCEAFLTNAQGKILGHAQVFCRPDSLVLDMPPGQQGMLAHLDRYLIREKVELIDRTGDWRQTLVAGREAAVMIARCAQGALPDAPLGHGEIVVASRTLWIRRTPMAGPFGWTIVSDAADDEAVYQTLCEAGATPIGEETIEALRIESFWPEFGRDMTSDNLPQEVARNVQAISFTKGCYIGQETVARIDALGHVNRRLVGVRFTGSAIPEPATGLSHEGKQVGATTTATFSPQFNAPLALAYVRRGSESPGTRLDSPLGAAEVVSLPVV